MRGQDLTRKVNEFFEIFYESHTEQGPSVFFCRADGLVIYYKNRLNKKIDENSIGALLGGVWQASRALAGFMPPSDDEAYFRLSYDTSSRGIYVLPFNFDSEDYYIGMIYFDEVNPAMIKARLRELVARLEAYLLAEVSDHEEDSKELLFTNITDEEMDNLFSFAKG